MDLSWVYPTQEQLIKIRALLRYFFKSLAQPLFTEAFYDTISAAAGTCITPLITISLTKELAPEPVYSQYHTFSETSSRGYPTRTPKQRSTLSRFVLLPWLTEILLTIFSTFTAYVKRDLPSTWPTKS